MNSDHGGSSAEAIAVEVGSESPIGIKLDFPIVE
jgi:hypothetical protein